MALDYGKRAIGVAVSDELKLTARPLTTLRRERRSLNHIIESIRALIVEYEVETLIVGLPLRMDGTRGEAALRVERFVQELQKRINTPVVAYDERLTSQAAEEILREQGASRRQRRARSDELAAAVILQDYLNTDAAAFGPLITPLPY